jgi:hypothetical protein
MVEDRTGRGERAADQHVFDQHVFDAVNREVKRHSRHAADRTERDREREDAVAPSARRAERGALAGCAARGTRTSELEATGGGEHGDVAIGR